MPATDDWYRNHFPVILESNKSHYFHEQIYNMMGADEYIFPTIEFGSAMSEFDARPQPYTTEDKMRNLKHIFNKDQI